MPLKIAAFHVISAAAAGGVSTKAKEVADYIGAGGALGEGAGAKAANSLVLGLEVATGQIVGAAATWISP